MNQLITFTIRDRFFKIYSDPNSEQICQQEICKNKTWEPWLTDYILDNLKPDSTFVDAGASIGWFTLLAASQRPNGHIIAFEPHTKRFNTLTRNVAENKLNNVIMIQAALSDKIDTTTIGGRANAQMGKPGETIATTTLDHILSKLNLKPDLIKLDIEGAEVRALHGMKKTLTNPGIKLAIEVHPTLLSNYGDTTQDLYTFTKNQGFKNQPLYGNYKVFEK